MTVARLRTVMRIDHDDWLKNIPDAKTLCRRAVRSGWRAGRKSLPPNHSLAGVLPGPIEISVLLSDDDTMRGLNRDHRGKDRATNVLSFLGDDDSIVPGADVLLGDIVLAWQTIALEAGQANKPVSDHMTHLVIHGVLHLLGYDHECEEDATVMEELEVEGMAQLGLPDPYAAGK